MSMEEKDQLMEITRMKALLDRQSQLDEIAKQKIQDLLKNYLILENIEGNFEDFQSKQKQMEKDGIRMAVELWENAKSIHKEHQIGGLPMVAHPLTQYPQLIEGVLTLIFCNITAYWNNLKYYNIRNKTMHSGFLREQKNIMLSNIKTAKSFLKTEEQELIPIRLEYINPFNEFKTLEKTISDRIKEIENRLSPETPKGCLASIFFLY
ncbi:hypothetical protein [Robiginitalea sediminis]|uniref:hypothetical protein n=1 Tax=Robiginitalea sediminis TaxID=1982593 RepID=UPI000B4AB183|nr:hypothetical protein [Robiginitalea sediminis]